MRVVLIRHAQASVQGPDYDQLSSHGYEQAVLLGKHLRTLPWHPSVVCVGPKLRHRQTWETLAMQGNTWPSATHHEALDELPAEWVMAAAMPLLAQQGHPVMSEAQALMGGKISVEAIQKLMSAAMTLWMAGEIQEEGVESWPEFRRRVHQTLEGLAAHAKVHEPTVAVTSADTGPLTRSQISRVTSRMSRPDFLISEGLVVTPSTMPRACSSAMASISAVSTKNFMSGTSVRLDFA